MVECNQKYQGERRQEECFIDALNREKSSEKLDVAYGFPLGRDGFPVCVPCGDGQGVSRDKSACMTCGDRTIFAEEVHDCLCEYDVRTFLIEDLELGATEGTKTCQAPDAGDVDFCKGDDSWKGPNKDEKGKRRDIYECQRCPLEGQIYDTDSDPYQCICSNNLNYLTAGDICLKEDEIDDIDDYKEDKAVEIQYESIESINSSGGYQIGDGEVDSGTFKYYYLKAAVGCKTKKNPKDCQTLANLCVLTFYDTEAQACVLYNELIEE